MRYNKRNWVSKVFVIGLALGCGVGPVMAGEDQPPPQAAVAAVNSEQDESPVFFETEGDFFLGYRWVSTGDSLKAGITTAKSRRISGLRDWAASRAFMAWDTSSGESSPHEIPRHGREVPYTRFRIRAGRIPS